MLATTWAQIFQIETTLSFIQLFTLNGLNGHLKQVYLFSCLYFELIQFDGALSQEFVALLSAS